MHNLLSILFGVALLAGCGPSSSSGGVNFSCEVKSASLHTCYEYDNVPSSTAMSGMTACTNQMGTPGTGCPSANKLGVCTEATSGGGTAKEFYYSDIGGLTASQAMMACVQGGGTWSLM
jgi:hypothetical protein